MTLNTMLALNKILLLIAFGLGTLQLNGVFAGTMLPAKNDHSKSMSNDRIALDGGNVLKRDKRYLLWTGGGISKVKIINNFNAHESAFIFICNFQLVLGFLAPIETRDRVNWRTMNLAYNYQFQYVPIPSVAFLWDRFSRNLREQRRQFDVNGIHAIDLTRELIYGAIELYLDGKTKAGRQCLLKSICDAAEHPIVHRGVFEQIIHLILT